MSKIVLEHIDKYYGENRVLKDINLTIEDGDFMTLLGPSGCGKTTTLRVISGLEKPQNGILTFISIAKEFDLISLVANERNLTLSYLTFSYTSLNCYQLAAASSVVMIVLISVLYLIAKKVFGADIVKGWS